MAEKTQRPTMREDLRRSGKLLLEAGGDLMDAACILMILVIVTALLA